MSTTRTKILRFWLEELVLEVFGEATKPLANGFGGHDVGSEVTPAAIATRAAKLRWRLDTASGSLGEVRFPLQTRGFDDDGL